MPAVAVSRDIREAILDAADSLLGRYGYKKMTVDEIAREARIGKATIYQHFASKKDVALARVDRVISRLNGELRITASGSDTPANRLRKMLVMRVLFRFDSVQGYVESIDEMFAAIRPELLEQRERHFEEESKVFASLLRDGKRSGEFKVKEIERTAHALLLATNSLLPYNLTVRQLGERDVVREKVLLIADLFLNGLLQKDK